MTLRRKRFRVLQFHLDQNLKNQNIPALKVCNLHVTFGQTHVLNGLDIALNTGEKLALIGAGGSGKSTLLKSILGIIPITKGDIEIFGKNINTVENSEKRELLRNVSMAFQMGALFDFMNVFDNISFALENVTNLGFDQRKEIIETYLNRVNLPNVGKKLPSELSGGMRRRVGICRALATKPKLALFDEPTAGLDPVTSQVVIDLIHELASEVGSSLVCVTSNIAVARSFAQEIGVIKDGRIVAQGSWSYLVNHNDPWVSQFLKSRDHNP